MAEEAANTAPAAGGSPMKLVIVMIVGAVLLVAVSMGGAFFLVKSMGMMNGGGGAAAQVKDESAPANYLPLEPAFVVNFKERGRTRFLQVEMEAMTRDPLMLEEMKKHMPVIRNNLLLLLSAQTAETLHSAEGKEQLRITALGEINTVIEKESGTKEAFEALYFKSFVTQ